MTESERFWAKVLKQPDGCWEWVGARTDRGYGVFQISQPRKSVRAHRWAYAEYHGIDIRDLLAEVVRHHCDNPCCVNPAHLAEGTHEDNARDRDSRGRTGRHGRYKLTEEQVEEIRTAPGSQRAVAARFGVTQSWVSRLRSVIVDDGRVDAATDEVEHPAD